MKERAKHITAVLVTSPIVYLVFGVLDKVSGKGWPKLIEFTKDYVWPTMWENF
jgi:hypothetical protein